MDLRDYWFMLCTAEDVYQPDIARLMKVFNGPDELYMSSENDLRKLKCIDRLKTDAIIRSRDGSRAEKIKQKLERDNIRFICPADSEYPSGFRDIPGMPYSLYVKGNMPVTEAPSVGMVGARACSGYGREKAAEVAAKLSVNGIQIISGMATGIDAVSQRAALEAGGKTFSVLGCGVDVIYPRENISLYYDIIMRGGGIISEYPPGTPPIAWQFPHRNRLISALSDRLIIIEAGKRSGTLSTAQHALDQGRDIYVLPGRTIDRLSEGCNMLIYDGAGILLDTDQFIADLYSSPRWERRGLTGSGINIIQTADEIIPGTLDNDCRNIYLNLVTSPCDCDTLSHLCGLSVEKVRTCLSEMEIDGFVIQISAGVYARNVFYKS